MADKIVKITFEQWVGLQNGLVIVGANGTTLRFLRESFCGPAYRVDNKEIDMIVLIEADQIVDEHQLNRMFAGYQREALG